MLAALVFDVGEQQACAVVAGDAAQLIAFGDEFAAGVLSERVNGAAWQGDLYQAVDYAFLIAARFIIFGNICFGTPV